MVDYTALWVPVTFWKTVDLLTIIVTKTTWIILLKMDFLFHEKRKFISFRYCRVGIYILTLHPKSQRVVSDHVNPVVFMRLGLQATYLFHDMRKSIFRTEWGIWLQNRFTNVNGAQEIYYQLQEYVDEIWGLVEILNNRFGYRSLQIHNKIRSLYK